MDSGFRGNDNLTDRGESLPDPFGFSSESFLIHGENEAVPPAGTSFNKISRIFTLPMLPTRREDGTGIAEHIVHQLCQATGSRSRRRKDEAMTQELVVGVLLTGMVGLIWAMAVTVLWGDRDDHTNQATDTPSERDRVNEPGSERRTMAA